MPTQRSKIGLVPGTPCGLLSPLVNRAWAVTLLVVLPAATAAVGAACGAEPLPPEARRPADEEELRYWLANMHVYHRFSPEEIQAATGLSGEEIRAALERFGFSADDRPPRKSGDPLVVLPYPGGRHPRLGFLDGAVRPQRETKISVFTPWDPASYVVVDVPEAIWSNLGLTYLAHTHVPTIWTERGIEMEKLEWRRGKEGVLTSSRRLLNGIRFEVTVTPEPERVRMAITLTNGTAEPLSGLRMQMCVMLGHAGGFKAQSSENKVYRHPYVACRSEDGRRWVITAWNPCFRTWANPECPCMHSDPGLPDCPPAAAVEATGYLWFYEGDDLDAELDHLAGQTGWAMDPEHPGPGPRRNPPQRR